MVTLLRAQSESVEQAATLPDDSKTGNFISAVEKYQSSQSSPRAA